eukprot:14167489-Alexandrium_andersonii.AAC.1
MPCGAAARTPAPRRAPHVATSGTLRGDVWDSGVALNTARGDIWKSGIVLSTMRSDSEKTGPATPASC